MSRIISLFVDSFSGLSRNIWLLSLITLVNRAGTIVLPFLSLYLTKNLSFDLTTAGLITSCYGVGSVIGTWVGGKLTDHFGFRRVMFWSLFLSGSLFMFLPYLTETLSLGAMILTIAIIGDAFRPASFVAINAYSKEGNLTRSLGLLRLAINLGFAIGPSVGGFIAFKYGYTWLFVVDSMTCMTAALMFWFVLPKAIGMTADPKLKSVESRASILKPYQDTTFLVMMASVFLMAFVFMQLFNTVPVFMDKELGLSEKWIGYILGFNGVLIALSEMPLIFVIEKKFSLLQLTKLGAGLIAISFGLLLLPLGPLPLMLIFMVVITYGEILNLPFANTYVQERSKRGLRGSYMGFYSMTFSTGYILTTSLGFLIADTYGFYTLWSICLVLGLIAFSIIGAVQILDRKDTSYASTKS